MGLRSYCNGVGAVIYGRVKPEVPRYEVKKVSELSMDKALRSMAQFMA